MARSDTYGAARPTFLPEGGRRFLRRRGMEAAAIGFAALSGLVGTALYSYDPLDPAANVAAGGPTRNLLGARGAQVADWLFQSLGLAAWLVAIVFLAWALLLVLHRGLGRIWLRLALLPPGVVLAAAALATLPPPPHLPLASGLGGSLGAITAHHLAGWLAPIGVAGGALSGAVFAALAAVTLATSMGLSGSEWLGGARLMLRGLGRAGRGARNAGAWAAGKAGDQARRLANGQESERRPRFAALLQPITRPFARMGIAVRESARKLWTKGGHDDHAASTSIGGERREPTLNGAASSPSPGPATPPRAQRTITLGAATDVEDDEARAPVAAPSPAMVPPVVKPTVVAPAREAPAKRADTTKQASLDFTGEGEPYRLPPLDLLSLPKNAGKIEIDEDALQQNARLLEAVLADFGVRGQIVKVRPGPVVTLYELEPAPGTKSSRVISLSDDIARSMSAVSVRVAVIPGRNVIGIELPNQKRETVWLRELLAVEAYERAQGRLALVLGKDIGGTPVVVDLARMPHLLIAGTTGSGKSVGINTMILSLLYRLTPEKCRLIMIDPKMLELSVYEGIPHLLAPVVTEPKKAVVALKWTVREMERRYRNMSKLGVRNIEGYNARLDEARRKGESLKRRIQTGFDAETGKPVFEDEPLELTDLPYIVVVVDEMADLMLVAGKDIEAAIQRLAQMARAAGIHLIMATQRPSVDVITGTIKANFPTRISFQVTSKIDSRTILGEQGAETLLGQGDMLYMAGGGRITRVHGPFVSDGEVEGVVNHLKSQAVPEYVEAVTEEEDEDGAFGGAEGEAGAAAGGSSGDDLYDQAVALVCRERKCSTSFIQRHLQIGYNRAARIVDRMEAEGVVGSANHVGKREVLARNIDDRET